MDNRKKTLRDRGYDVANNVYAGYTVIAFSAVAGTLYSHYGPSWAKSVMDGLITGAVAAGIYTSWRAFIALPLARQRITPENAGPIVLGWLHKFNLTVKSHSDPDYAFFYQVKTDGLVTVKVFRSLYHHSDYITLQSTVVQTPDTKAVLGGFSEEEKVRAILDVKLALSRAVMGYSATNWLEQYTVFKKVPITENLVEDQLINAIWEMEAIINTTRIIEILAAGANHNRLEREKLEREQNAN